MRHFNDFRAHVFTEMLKIINNSNCSSYKILGYGCLTQRLILFFRDCNEVHEWDFFVDYEDKTKDGEITHVKFFTADKNHDDYIDENKRFSEDFKRDIAEKL